MLRKNGVTTIAEDKYAFKTDVNLIFGNQRTERTYVLRTTLHHLSVWKTRNPGASLSPFKSNASVIKQGAIIDNEVWIFNVNATLAQDIVAAVKIAALWHKVQPKAVLQEVYAKNLNAEQEETMLPEVLIRANESLYIGTCKAIKEAAKLLGVSRPINFYVFSKNNNNKIPAKNLHEALKKGGSETVETDENKTKIKVGSNDGNDFVVQLTNFHLAKLSIA